MGVVALATGILFTTSSLTVDPGWIHTGPGYSTVAHDDVWFGLYNHGPNDLIALDHEEFYYTNYCKQASFSGAAASPPWSAPFQSLYSSAGLYTCDVNDSISPYTKRTYYLTYNYIGSPRKYFDPTTNSLVTIEDEPAVEGWDWLEDTSIEGLFDPPISSYVRLAAKKWQFGVRIVNESLPESEDEGDGAGDGSDTGDLGGGAG